MSVVCEEGEAVKLIKLSFAFFPRFDHDGTVRGFWSITHDGVPQEPSFLNDFENWFEWCRWKHERKNQR